MTYRLDTADMAEPTSLGQGLWLRSPLPNDVGECKTDLCRLDDGLALAYAHYRPRRDLLERSTIKRDSRSLTITVALEGESSTIGTDGQRFDFIVGHSTMTAFSSVRGERRFPADRLIRQLRLIASEPLLRRWCANVGTNEFKLKQGFREMFGTSPYRMLTDIRIGKLKTVVQAECCL